MEQTNPTESATVGSMGSPILTKNLNPLPQDTKVLVVDDAEDTRIILDVFLRHEGAKVLTAADAAQAIRMALLENPQVILMDMQLPDMDGCEATALLKQEGYRGSIIAMTGSSRLDERERCMLAGCSDYVSKPIRLEDLRERIDRQLSH